MFTKILHSRSMVNVSLTVISTPWWPNKRQLWGKSYFRIFFITSQDGFLIEEHLKEYYPSNSPWREASVVPPCLIYVRICRLLKRWQSNMIILDELEKNYLWLDVKAMIFRQQNICYLLRIWYIWRGTTNIWDGPT